MNRKKSVYQFMAKVLVIIMIFQGMHLWEMSNAYKWEFNPDKFQKILDVLSVFGPSEAQADPKKPAVITETVTVNNKKTVFVHNIVQGTKTVTSPENRTVTTVYDPATLLTSSVSITGLFETTYEYDGRGRKKSVKTGTRETLFDYDSDGNLDFITDPDKHITDFDYDEMGRVKEIHRPDMTDLYFDYDENGNMEILTVPKPEARTVDHIFGYNSVNLENSYTTPLTESYSYIYDRDRRLTKKIFPSGDEISYIYEPGKDRLEQIQTPEGNIDSSVNACGNIRNANP